MFRFLVGFVVSVVAEFVTRALLRAALTVLI